MCASLLAGDHFKCYDKILLFFNRGLYKYIFGESIGESKNIPTCNMPEEKCCFEKALLDKTMTGYTFTLNVELLNWMTVLFWFLLPCNTNPLLRFAPGRLSFTEPHLFSSSQQNNSQSVNQLLYYQLSTQHYTAFCCNHQKAFVSFELLLNSKWKFLLLFF